MFFNNFKTTRTGIAQTNKLNQLLEMEVFFHDPMGVIRTHNQPNNNSIEQYTNGGRYQPLHPPLSSMTLIRQTPTPPKMAATTHPPLTMQQRQLSSSQRQQLWYAILVLYQEHCKRSLHWQPFHGILPTVNYVTRGTLPTQWHIPVVTDR